MIRRPLPVSQTSRLTGIIAAALVAALAGCSAPPPRNIAVWSEFLPYDRVQEQLPELADFGASLYVAVRPDSIGDPLWSLMRAAAEQGVSVRPWLLLPDQGMWLHEQNIPDFDAFATDFLDQAAEAGVQVDWIIFDLEPSIEFAVNLTAEADNQADFFAYLADQANHTSFTISRTRLQSLVDNLHARNVKVMAATLPWIVDDLGDGDPDLQDLFNTPLADIPWDEVSVMTYRPIWSNLFRLPFTPAFVARYAAQAKRFFGDRAEIAIGHVGTPGLLVEPGYLIPSPLVEDATASVMAGVDRISIYSLDGLVEQGGARTWLAALRKPATLRPNFFNPMLDIFSLVVNSGDLLATILGVGTPDGDAPPRFPLDPYEPQQPPPTP